MNLIQHLSQGLYYRIMTPFWKRKFTPHIERVRIADKEFRFYFSNEQADEWYFPPKAHALLEYEWVVSNIRLSKERIVDVGAHHGHYSMFFASAVPKPEHLTAVEPLPSNCTVIEINAALNNYNVEIIEAAVSNNAGVGTLIPRTNGKLYPGVGINVPTIPLHTVDESATVIKLDVEGSEFQIFPQALEMLKNVHTWIIEIHPKYGDAREITGAFTLNGYHISILDKHNQLVRDLSEGEVIKQPTSIFCRR